MRKSPFGRISTNPDRLLRHGQTGIILVYLQLRDAIVIPMQATHEMMGKRYVDVVDEEDIVHRREIVVQVEMDDVLAIKEGVGVDDRIVLEGEPTGARRREGGIHFPSPAGTAGLAETARPRRREGGIRVSVPREIREKARKTRPNSQRSPCILSQPLNGQTVPG